MAPTPVPEPEWPVPRLSLRIEDLAHPGASIFLEAVNPLKALRAAVIASFTWLYTPATVPKKLAHSSCPRHAVHTLTLILRHMPGVAHATGGVNNKEIHFSLDYIAKSAGRARHEIQGVLTHETVHCFQYNALDSCPGGLIEGVADYVRLRTGFDPPHWKQKGGDDWDAGYETTAYFLAWLEERYGDGTVQELNARLNGVPYDARIFKRTTGRPVAKLWRIYCAHLEERGSQQRVD
ncbi:hypothetical protein D9615_001110 [Tricholomella constricta]|uniref:Plant basic secretory protein n=1 Tax=Tricholomella constricta TaxID=117010 RepID=A0A8H5HKN5_9AGAR|nr:hypothetical protein D9615_001110 [Tricholomella constricta]